MSRRIDRPRRSASTRRTPGRALTDKRRGEPEEPKKRSVFGRQMVSVYLLCSLFVGVLLLYANGPEVFEALVGRFGTGIPTSVLDGSLRSSPIEELDERDFRQMGKQRAKIAELARRHVGRVPTGSIRDIELIQELLTRKAIESDDRWTLQGLGITLGDILAQQFALQWVVVNDSYGRSRALQIGDEEDLVYPVTMISKRVEAGHTVYVDDLYERAADTIREVKRRRGL